MSHMPDLAAYRAHLMREAELTYQHIPEAVVRNIRAMTPEMARAQRLANLRESIDFYHKRLAETRAAAPGAVINCIIHTQAMLEARAANLAAQLERVDQEYREFALAEVAETCDRIGGYSFRREAAE